MAFNKSNNSQTHMTDDLLNPSLAALRRGHKSDPAPVLATRLDRLRRLRALLLEREADLLDALSHDFGYRSKQQSAFADITTTVKSVNHAIKNLSFWMQSQRRQTDLSLRFSGARCESAYTPKGVVGILSPWNFPINLALSPLASALAAGNTAFIKPSEITAATAERLAHLIPEYFGPEEVQVALGDVETSRRFAALPFDHLIYTGGEQVAKSIMRSAADNLVPLTLELGGKCPVLVGPGADLDLVARKVAFGKYFNAGQICIAPDYVLMTADQLDQFLPKLARAVARADASTTDNDAVSIINARHKQRLEQLITDAKSKGAQLHHFGSEKPGGYSLHVAINPGEDADICREEIFGPSLMIKTADSLASQIAMVGEGPHPLAIYVFGDRRTFDEVAKNSQSGALIHNDIIFQYANDDLPFGGIGASGMGKYRGIDGFREFSNHRAIYRGGGIDVSKLVTPPYPRIFGAINKIMRKL